jgi:type II secretory pathway pseudopilin PulG
MGPRKPPHRQREAGRRTTAAAGFTVTELVVVVAVIAVIVALVVPATRRVMASARTVKCLANQRQLTMAFHSYATSNAGRLACPRTDGNGDTIQARVDGQDMHLRTLEWDHFWVRAFTLGGHVGVVTVEGLPCETAASITSSALFPYVGDAKAYLSPDEPASRGKATVPPRVRSYSVNCCLGVTRPNENKAYDRTFTSLMHGERPALDSYDTTTIARVRRPARTMSTIVEDDSANYNAQGWVIQVDRPEWTDSPAHWRPDAIAFSSFDGSTETHAVADPSLPAAWAANGHGVRQQGNGMAGATIDWKFFRDRMNPGVLPGCSMTSGEN